MKNKNSGKLLLVLALAIFSMVFVSAADAITINNPVKYGNYSTTMNVSITNNYVNQTLGDYNVSLYCNKSGGSVEARTGADTTKVVTIRNSTTKDFEFENAAVSISSLTDVNSLYNCSAYADNDTDQAWAAVAIRYITKDNTSPVCSISKSYPTIHKDGPQLLTWSVTDAISLVSSTTYVNRPSPGSQMSYTSATETSFLYGGLNTTYTGTYNLNAYGIDRAGNICNATTSFNADQPGGTVTVSTTGGLNKKAIVIVALLLIGAFLLFRKKR